MATISPRTLKSGIVKYTAQIRLNIDGERYTETRSGLDRAALDKWATERERVLREPGALRNERHTGVTLGHVLAWYRADFNGASKFGRTKLSHIDYLENHPEFSQLDAVSLKTSQLINHANKRAQTAAPATINNDFVWLRNAMRAVSLSRDLKLNLQVVDDAMYLLRKEGIIGKAKRRERRPGIDELNILLDYFTGRDGRATLPMVDLVLFALFSSRRQEEITCIRWEDIDRRRKGVLVREMKHPREKVDTFCILPEEALAIIDRQPQVGELIFPYNSKSISGAFTRACNFLEIDDLHFHDLRHECVSWLFELGLDIPRVAAVSGHKSWSSLQRYTHLREHGTFNKYEGWEWSPQKYCI